MQIRKICLLLVLIFATVNATAQQTAKAWVFAYFKGNGEDGLHLASSRDGYNWTALKGDSSFLKPTAGRDKLMRDPCIIRMADGLFHMVWTVSWGERSIGYASSRDLIHWSDQKTIPVMEKDTTTLNAWAPEIYYDAASREYIIYWASTIPGKFTMTGVKAGSKYNHRMYYATTKNFKTFKPARLMYDKGFSVIDATIQKNGKDFVMFLKNENDNPVEKNLRIATSTSPDKNYGDASAPITGNYWAEGPTILKNGNKWLVYFDKYTLHKYGAIESTDLKNWLDVSDKITVPKGMRHGTIVEISAQELNKL